MAVSIPSVTPALNALPTDDHLTKSHLTLGKAWDEVRFDNTEQTVLSDRSRVLSKYLQNPLFHGWMKKRESKWDEMANRLQMRIENYLLGYSM